MPPSRLLNVITDRLSGISLSLSLTRLACNTNGPNGDPPHRLPAKIGLRLPGRVPNGARQTQERRMVLSAHAPH